MNNKIFPVILSGGFGKRLWPLSHDSLPKQFLPLINQHSLFDLTIKRLMLINKNITFLLSENHRFHVIESILKYGINKNLNLILEPEPKNTGPAIAIALQKFKDDDVLLFCPSDQLISDNKLFCNTVFKAKDEAERGSIVIFGIKPLSANSELGYIQYQKNKSSKPIYSVKKFIEKPDADKAKFLLDSGDVLWNAGILMAKKSALIDAFNIKSKNLLTIANIAMKQSKDEVYSAHKRSFNFIRPDINQFSKFKSISFDYAVLEHCLNIKVTPFKSSWSDLGNWDSLSKNIKKSKNGNRIIGNNFVFKSNNNFIYSEKKPIVTLGIDDSVIVESPDAIFIAKKEFLGHIKNMLNHLTKDNSFKSLKFERSITPWGKFVCVDRGVNYKVKRLVIRPNQSISLQKHKYRSEHWVVVSGEAEVIKGSEIITVQKNQSIFISKNQIHRLTNNKAKDLVVIEVQTGDYLEDDDITRLKDSYGRQ